MKKIHKKMETVLKNLQKKIKKCVDKNRKEIVKYKIKNKILLSIKNLIQQIRNRKIKKLTEKFIKLYKIKKLYQKIQ